MYTKNSKITTKIIKSYSYKPTKEIKWNHKNSQLIQKKVEKEKRGEKADGKNRNQMEIQPYHINHIKRKWSKYFK